jgi:hypothetical protein
MLLRSIRGVLIRHGMTPVGVGVLAMCWCSMVQRIQAQSTNTPNDSMRVRVAAAGSTAAERYTELGMVNKYLRECVPDTVLRVPIDSLRRIARARLDEWIAELDRIPQGGLQRDPMGALYAMADRDADAAAQFDARLAMPDLTVADRTHTLLLAVNVFADPGNPARMARALRYLARLDSLPSDAAAAQFQGHIAMTWAYRGRNDVARALNEAMTAYRIVPAIPFFERGPAFNDQLFRMVVDLLVAQSAITRVDSLGKALLQYAVPTPEAVADDAWTAKQEGASYAKNVRQVLQQLAMIGRPAPPIVANYWFNTNPPVHAATPEFAMAMDGGTSRTLTLNDGTIRLLEFGDKGCPHCVESLPGLGRLKAKLPPRVELWYITETTGAWGPDLVDANVEVQQLRRFYVDFKDVSTPIALWAGVKQPNEDGGAVPAPNANIASYKVQGSPRYVIVDGRGIVRFVISGYSRGLERKLLETLEALSAEAASPATTSSVSHPAAIGAVAP